MEKDARFDLSHAELDPFPKCETALSRTFELEDGAIQICLETETAS